jgi:hypothetical protein
MRDLPGKSLIAGEEIYKGLPRRDGGSVWKRGSERNAAKRSDFSQNMEGECAERAGTLLWYLIVSSPS